MRRALRRLRTPNVVLAQGVSVILAGVMVVSVGLVALTMMRDGSASATRDSRAAALAHEVSAVATQVELMASSWGGPAGMRPRLVVEAADLLSAAEEDAAELHRLSGTATSLQVLGAVRDARGELLNYAETGQPQDLAAFADHVSALRSLTAGLASTLTASADQQGSNLGAVLRLAYAATVVAMALGGLIVGGTTFQTSRRLRAALMSARDENARLAGATEMMRRRNEQFQALNQIVSEITETLSLKYVVQTTIREARKLVGADVVILRLLRGDHLELAGTLQDVDGDVAGLTTLKLGQGVVGRAARRGKALRIGEDAEETLTPGEGFPGAQSGVVVPLIVGARVVGTLACWSRRPNLFTAEDQQVLEMMASQVATAVAAADAHETTEHEAHHDALTSLPNRRQLFREIQERFDPALAEGRQLAVVMVDIDHFKRFNDEFGHRVGDVTLQRFAETLRTALRETDNVYRYGGEEFVIILEGLPPPEAVHLVDRVRQAVARTPLVGENLEPIGSVTMSAGVAFGPANAGQVEELLRLADAALYRAKHEGRNRVCVHEDGAPATAEAA